MTNIDGSHDAGYRYKMPVLVAKYMGKGNGVKTVLENISDVARSLHRPASYIVKYFAYELGTISNDDTINGHHPVEDLQRILMRFIRACVLCAKCNLPETRLGLKHKKIIADCDACGHARPVLIQHKIAMYIGLDLAKKIIVQDHQVESEVPQSKDDTLEISWSVDTSPEAVEKRRQEFLAK